MTRKIRLYLIFICFLFGTDNDLQFFSLLVTFQCTAVRTACTISVYASVELLSMFAEHTDDCMLGMWCVQDRDFNFTPTQGTTEVTEVNTNSFNCD